MQKLLINGKKELSGKILISGSKNATLPILAATIFSRQVKLKNIPLVKDIFTMVELLKFIGLKTNISKNKNSIEIINRATGFVKYLADSWSVLSTIKAEGFNEFRDYLGTASGQLSFMYRHVEFILGNKSIRMASAHKNVPHIWPEIEKSLHTPSLYDEVIFYLNREGYEISKDILERDWSKRYKTNSSVKDAWLAICKNPSTENKLFQLAESLITFEEHYAIYRWKHFILVKKMIGYKSGTGGSAGVGWLEKVTEHHFFPELWDIRNDF